MINLAGKAAIVTGASRGIGREICLHLARAGADVVVHYRSHRDEALSLVQTIEEMGRRALAVGGDLSTAQANETLFSRTLALFGKVDIVVANAGIWKRAPIDEMTEAQWHETISSNLDSIYHICRLASSQMKKQQEGKLILISSTAGQRGEAFHAHYAASKGAILALTKSLANELGYYNINVNCVAPGWVRTEMTADVFADRNFRETVEQSIPLRRIAQAKDVAGPVLFLASDLARHLQGEILGVNGGSVLC